MTQQHTFKRFDVGRGEYECRMSLLVWLRRERDRRYSVSCPSFPGVFAAGGSKAEALREMSEALTVTAETYADRGLSFPLTDSREKVPKGVTVERVMFLVP